MMILIFHFRIENYDNLADFTVFLQGELTPLI